MIEKFPGKCCFPYLFWFLQLKFRLRNSDMFVGCLHHLNYSSVGLSILTSCLGWSGGAMVLDKLPVPGHLTNLDESRTRAYCACSRCGWGLFGNLIFCLSFLFSFSLSLAARYRLKYCLKGPLNPKQPTNQLCPATGTFFRFLAE